MPKSVRRRNKNVGLWRRNCAITRLMKSQSKPDNYPGYLHSKVALQRAKERDIAYLTEDDCNQ
jgi:hypothetical protein